MLIIGAAEWERLTRRIEKGALNERGAPFLVCGRAPGFPSNLLRRKPEEGFRVVGAQEVVVEGDGVHGPGVHEQDCHLAGVNNCPARLSAAPLPDYS